MRAPKPHLLFPPHSFRMTLQGKVSPRSRIALPLERPVLYLGDVVGTELQLCSAHDALCLLCASRTHNRPRYRRIAQRPGNCHFAGCAAESAGYSPESCDKG